MMKKDTKIKPKIKPVSFVLTNETDLKILDFINNNNIAFSSYVKDLIVKDMRKLQENNEIADAINNLTSAITNVISNNNISITQNNNIEDKTNIIDEKINVDEEKKSIIGNILNMSNK
ncbi:hypothetical protein [Clostridium botulinum]|uniref:hypothetical protein n=1 Tax=Clostridium botulinum TaxID=1491 RepID=UPI0007736250|nr:hypothetical protein [Clostridium botulinum]NFN09384.1 hypothetical protein [Clostridium botulinum]NFN32936.1 hypothetical protein [Clostridium botulinum]